MLRIAFVTPLSPLKGGIARFSGLLMDALRARGYDVLAVAFRALYPDFLTKGATEEPSAATVKSSESRLVLFNPFTWPDTIRQLIALKPDILLVAYWTGFLAPLYYVLRRFTGIKTVVLLHNLSSHDSFFFEPLMQRLLAASSDGFLTLSGVVLRQVRAAMPKIPSLQLFHPFYEPEVEMPSASVARSALKLDSDVPVVLFYGYVRHYKGLDIMLRAMPAILRQEPSLRLVVAGQFHQSPDRYRKLIGQLGIGANVDLYPGYVSRDRSALFFAAADAVVVPYRSATQSGVVQLAYGHGLPVIVTPVGALAEMVRHAETGWIARDASPEGFAAAVGEFLDSGDKLPAMQSAIASFCRELSWEAFAAAAGPFLEAEAFGR